MMQRVSIMLREDCFLGLLGRFGAHDPPTVVWFALDGERRRRGRRSGSNCLVTQAAYRNHATHVAEGRREQSLAYDSSHTRRGKTALALCRRTRHTKGLWWH